MRKSPVVTNTKKKRETKKSSKLKLLLHLLNKLMPYILAVAFVVILFSVAGIAGGMGKGISGVLYGLFSNFATYFVAIFMLFHSLMWYYDSNRGICARRVICSLITVFCVAALQHLITLSAGNAEASTFSVKVLYSLGASGIGGGVIGGVIGMLLHNLLSAVGGIITVCIILFFMMLQMFNITPASLLKNRISRKKAEKAEATAKEKEKKRISASLKHRKFNVFDDEDDNNFTTSTIDSFNYPTIEVERPDSAPLERIPAEAPAVEARRPSSLYESKTKAPISEFELSSPFPTDERKESPVIESRPTYERAPVTEFGFGERPAPVAPNKNDFTTSDFKIDGPVVTDEIDAPKPVYKEYDYERSSRPDYEERKPVYEPPKPVYEAPKPIYEESKPTYETTRFEPVRPVYEERKAAVPVWDDTEPVNDYEDTFDYDDFEEPVKDDLEAAIFKEENKDATFSDFLSNTAYQQINGRPKEPEFKVEKRAAEPTAPVAPPPPPPVKKAKRKYVFPPVDIFENRIPDPANQAAEQEELEQNARTIVGTLCNFNAKTKIVDIQRGPTVTRYELVPEAGVRVRTIAGLVDDIALSLAADGIRIECPIPGKAAVGIEVPNKITSTVYLRSLLEDPQFKKAKSVATCAVGKSISGENIYIDIAKMPHLLVAGATGMGKSVCINALLISLLYKASPDDLRLILIDPKRVEFSVFNGLPHLLVPVVCEAKKSIGTLQWAVAEMERRFEKLGEVNVRDIGEFNDRVDRGVINDEKFARIVIVIDELYDLKMQVPEIDEYIIRLTQKARAAGIHVIIGTQRPSVDVITGVIKANIPSRISFRVPAQVDSRTILDEVGAEKLVSRGDMLLKPVGALKPIRVQGAFINETEREAVVNFIKEHSSENYDESVVSQIEVNTSKLAKADKSADADGGEGGGENELDEKFYAALEIATDMGKISSSHLQRKLNLGFQRAARIIDQMESMGYIGEQNGSKPRDVLITKEQFMELRMKSED